MKLLPEETQIDELGGLIITNLRVFSKSSAKGKSDYNVIPIKKVAHIESKYISYPPLIIIGILALLSAIGLYMDHPESTDNPFPYAIGFIGLLLIIFYFLSIRFAITITSDGGVKLIGSGKQIKKELIEDFIAKILHEIK
jgi:hypothetical protein